MIQVGDLDVMVSSQGQWSNTYRGQEGSRSHSDGGSQGGGHCSEWVESCEGSRGGSQWSWSNSDWSWGWWWGQGEGQWSWSRTEELSGLSWFVLFPPDDSPLASPHSSPRHLVPHHLAPVATHPDDVTEAGLRGGLGQTGHHRQAE